MIVNMPVSLLVLATGQPATDLAQVCVTADLGAHAPGSYVSYQVVTPAGVAGVWSVEDSADNPPTLAGNWDAFPADSYSSTPTQPSGGGSPCITTLLTLATCPYKRLKWTPTSGGSGKAVTSIRLTKGGV
jgi:hypothetical protein